MYAMPDIWFVVRQMRDLLNSTAKESVVCEMDEYVMDSLGFIREVACDLHIEEIEDNLNFYDRQGMVLLRVSYTRH